MSALTLPKCRQRGEQIAADRWTCHSQKLVVPARVVTGEFCATQCPYVDHVDSAIEVLGKRNTNGALHSRMTVDEFRAKIAKPNGNYPKGWYRWQVAQLAHRRMLEDAVANAPVYPGGYAGRGIVIAAGGPVYFACAYVCVSVLRELGCQLPVEFWHLGRDEIDVQMAELVAPLGVTCRDARTVQPQPRLLNGWELKPFAVVHSAFEEVLFLDADNVPVRDPTYLFDDPRYRQKGAMFWPDLPAEINAHDWIPDVTWDVACIADRDGPPFESGQLLIDKSQCWRELAVTMHINEHSDFWYKYVHGDKDTFKLAWRKLERSYAMPERIAEWDWPAIFQFDLDGALVFTHACQGKRQLRTGETLPALPRADLAARAGDRYQKLSRDRQRLASRDAFEIDCRQNAGDVSCGDNGPACRVLGKLTLFCDDGDQAIVPHLKNDGFWESWISVAMSRLIRPGDYCVDVGANCGYYTLLMADRAGRDGKVMAIEPNPRMSALLRRSLAANQLDVEVVEAAVTNQLGETPFYLPANNTLNSSVIADFFDAADVQTVPTTTLDHLLASWPRVDLIKIDVEGAEEMLWDGANETWDRPEVKVILEIRGNRYRDARAFLHRIAARFPLRFIDSNGAIRPTSIEAILKVNAQDWMLYLSKA